MSTHLNLWNHFHALLITLQLPLQVIRNQFLVRRRKPEPRKHRRRSYRDLYSPRYPTNHRCLSRTRSSFHIDLSLPLSLSLSLSLSVIFIFLYVYVSLCVCLANGDYEMRGKWNLMESAETEKNGKFETPLRVSLAFYSFLLLCFFLSFGCFASSSPRSLELSSGHVVLSKFAWARVSLRAWIRATLQKDRHVGYLSHIVIVTRSVHVAVIWLVHVVLPFD